jgi:N-methylhydantoinase A/oxoprolinase/acetone carboxylase beta subunit
VPLPGSHLEPELLPSLHDAFYAAYRQQYGREIREVPVETVSWRLNVSGPRPTLDVAWPSPTRDGGDEGISTHPKGERLVFFPMTRMEGDDPVLCPIFERTALAPGLQITGPAVLEDQESTTVVPPGATMRVDDERMLIIDLGSMSR